MRKCLTKLFILFVVIVGGFGEKSVAQQSPITGSEIARRLFPSVVLLICEDSHSQPVALGSGFLVADDIVATNLHVITGASGGYAKLIGLAGKYRIKGVVAADDAHDLALLSVQGIHAPTAPLGRSEQVAVGDEIYAIGNPIGLEGTMSQGIVSGIRAVGSDSLLQITAPISPGSSGGPVVNLHGEVIGLAVSTLKLGQNLNFAVPSSYLTTLLSRRTEAKPFPEKKRSGGKRDNKGIGPSAVSGVTAAGFLWNEDIGSQNDCEIEGTCWFSFTLRNGLKSSISQTRYVAIFFDGAGAPVDAHEDVSSEIVRPGLATRVSLGGHVDATVRRLTRRVEIRVLDFAVEK